MANTKAFCAYPFAQAVVRTGGSIGPCCLMPGVGDVRKESLLEFWQGSSMRNLRHQMLTGNTDIPACYMCSAQESRTGNSMRLESLRDYKFLSPAHYERVLKHYGWQDLDIPARLEVHVGNLCNLKCLTCRPEDSSKFLVEDRALGISNHNQSDYELPENFLDSVAQAIAQGKIELLDLRGGESMLVPAIKKFLSELEDTAFDQVKLRIQTNGTVLDDEWKKLLQRFKNVEVMLSIDAVGESNTYIRYPSVWDDIERNSAWFKTQSHIKLYINCTISNLNVLLLPELVEWCRQSNIFFHGVPLTKPVFYQFNNLPAPVFQQAQEKLSAYGDQFAYIVKATVDDTAANWQAFCRTIDLRDQYRRNRIFDILPELKQYWV
jgi:MoaA/NifB/PqqE/SkfB family radical SAM enzyme